MGFLDWFRPVQNIASPFNDENHLQAVTMAELFPSIDPSLLPVSRELAMQIPALARARNLICTSIGRLPLVAYNADGPLAQQPDIVRRPDPGHPAYITWSWTVDELLFYGRAWFYRIPGGRLRLYPQTGIDFDDQDQPTGFRGNRLAGDWLRVDSGADGILTTGRQAIRAALAVETAYRRAADMPVPAIDLHQTTPNPQLSRTERQALISDWAAARNGKNGGVAYTSFNIEAKPLGTTAENLLISARNAAALDMARLCGLPAWAVDATTGGSSLTYSNLVDRNRELTDYSLATYMAPLEARFSLDDVLPAGSWARFSTSDWLRGDLKARAESYVAARDAGILTQQQIIDAERGIPAEG